MTNLPCHAPCPAVVRRLRPGAASAALAVLLATVSGCGGGGDGGEVPPPVDPGNDTGTTITSELQAKKILARGVILPADIDFLGTALVDIAILASLESGPGTRTVPCTLAGSVTYSLVDADNSGTLSTGDHATVTLANCQEAGTDPVSGSVRTDITLAQGDIAAFYNGDAPGALRTATTFTNLSASGFTVNGSYLADATRATSGGAVAMDFGLRGVTAGGTGVMVTLPTFSYTRTLTSTTDTTQTAAGQFTTQVDGLGTVSYAVALLAAYETSTQPARMQLSNASGRIIATLQPDGSVRVEVDNGADGSNEFDFMTRVEELDALIQTP